MHVYIVEDGHGDVSGRYDFCSNHCHEMFVWKSPFKWVSANVFEELGLTDEPEFGSHCCECGAMIPGAFEDPEAI